MNAKRRIPPRSGAAILAALLLGAGAAAASELAPEDLEFFEQKIRPVLVEHCYTCHNSTEIAESGLRLDYRGGLLEGGMRGPAIEPGKPRSSLLLRAMRHPSLDFRMPLGGAKLPDDVVADFERWIEIGAPDPRDEPPLRTRSGRSRPGRRRWSNGRAGGACSRSPSPNLPTSPTRTGRTTRSTGSSPAASPTPGSRPRRLPSRAP